MRKTVKERKGEAKRVKGRGEWHKVRKGREEEGAKGRKKGSAAE